MDWNEVVSLFRALMKTAVGPFIGASLAFASTLLIQRRNRRRDDLSAGNLALLSIVAQLDDYLNYRLGMRLAVAQRASGIALSKPMPLWLLAHPVVHHFSDRSFDYKSLSFLLDRRPGQVALSKLANLERAYFDLKERQAELARTAVDVQQCLADRMREHTGKVEVGALNAAVGIELRVRAADQLVSVMQRLDQDEDLYVGTFKVLRDQLVPKFDERRLAQLNNIPEKYSASALPALPPELTQALAALR